MKKKKSPKKYLKNYLMSLVFLLIGSIAFWVQEQGHEVRTPDVNTPIELYASQVNDNLGQTFSAAIGEAKNSVLLIVYSLTDEKIIECLNRQSQKGVNVKVICDAKASPYVVSKLRNVDLTRRFGNGLMHQKILVVDREKVWLGSANMTPESLQMHPNLVAALHSSSLANKVHNKADTMKEEGVSSSTSQEDFIIGGQKIEMWFLPDNNKQALQRLKTLIEGAKKTIRVAMFAWTRPDLAKSVVEASKRGVDVQVVVDQSLGKGTGSKVVKYLKDNQINVALSTGSPLLHHKFLYIDGEMLVHGSTNWTQRAFTENDDCFIVMHNLSEKQKEQMEAVWKVIKRDSCAP